MNKLEYSEHGLKIHDNSYACPTSADDMVIVSLVKHGLDALMDTCYQHSIQDHYLYNSAKCNVLVFNESNSEYSSSSRSWHLGPNIVTETSSYVHLGVLCEKNMSLNDNIDDACSKLRKTYFSLADCGVHRHGLHPITIKRIYESVVLPRALFGCELWNTMTDTHIQSLERVHRQCVKHMQSMGRYTRTDIALSFIGLLPIEYEIDKRKLLLLGQLCNMDYAKRVKRIFASRLVKYINEPSKIIGVMPDIYRICGKYNLTNILNVYVENASFPAIVAWKNTVKNAIRQKANTDLSHRLLNNEGLFEFTVIHNQYTYHVVFGDSVKYIVTICRTVKQPPQS